MAGCGKLEGLEVGPFSYDIDGDGKAEQFFSKTDLSFCTAQSCDTRPILSVRTEKNGKCYDIPISNENISLRSRTGFIAVGTSGPEGKESLIYEIITHDANGNGYPQLYFLSLDQIREKITKALSADAVSKP